MSNCPLYHPELMPQQKVILESEYSLFLQMPQEVLVGSGLIVPKAHRETVFDLMEEEWHDIYLLLQKVKRFLDETLFPDGYKSGLELWHRCRSAHSPRPSSHHSSFRR
jgi:histidine triad (HIT) family protein